MHKGMPNKLMPKLKKDKLKGPKIIIRHYKKKLAQITQTNRVQTGPKETGHPQPITKWVI